MITTFDVEPIKPTKEVVTRELRFAYTALGVLYATTLDDTDSNTAEVISQIRDAVDDALYYLTDSEEN